MSIQNKNRSLQLLTMACACDYFCDGKTVIMQHENHKAQIVKNRKDILLRDQSGETNLLKKRCKHRGEDGWCSKTRQKCPLLNFIFINQ